MKLKKLLSFALALCMVLAFIPAMSLTASAAETQTLWDINSLGLTSGGSEITPSSTYGLTSSGYVKFNTSNWVDGVWTSGTTYDPTLSFFKSSSASSTNETEYVTFDNAASTKGAETVTVDFVFASMTGKTSNYHTFTFYDNDSNAFAKFYYDNGTEQNNSQFRVGVGEYTYLVEDNDSSDDRDAVNALIGLAFRITVEEGTDAYIVTYSYDSDSDGVYETIATEEISSVNGIYKIEDVIGGWSTQWTGAGLQDLAVTYVMPETTVSVTATYTVDGETVATAAATYDTETATAASFDEIYAYYEGEVYYAAATELSADDEIEMSLVEHYTATTESFAYDGISYVPTGTSVIVNGNFITGDTSAWTNRSGSDITGATFSTEEGIDGNVMTISTSGSAATNSIGTSWAVEEGGLYYLSFYVGGTKPSSNNYTYNQVFQSDKSTTILAYGANMVDSTWTKMEVVFTATGDSIYFQGSWASTIKYAAFELIPVEVDSSVSYYSVSYAYEDGTTFYEESTKVASGTVIAARTFYADGKIYTTPETIVEDADVVITASVAQEYAVQKDTLWTQDQEIRGGVSSDHLFVAAFGTDYGELRAYGSDEDGNNVYNTFTATLGKSRYAIVQYALPTYEEGKTYTLVLPVNSFHTYCWDGGGNTNDALRFAAYRLADGTEFEDQSEGITGVASYASVGNAIYSDWVTSSSTELVFDITDAVQQASGDTITFKILANVGAVYLNEWEITVFGGDKEGLASYIEVSDGDYTVTVDDASTLTVNGSLMSDTTAAVNDGDYIYAYGKDYYYEATSGTIYDGSTKIEVTSNLELTGMSLGVELVDGAQIRVGDGLDTDSKITTDSGIRFIATVKTENTLAVLTGAEIGIAIWDGGYEATPTQDLTADPSTYGTPAVTRTADTYQGEGIFSLAITDIAEDNFNRIYVAAPYVVVNGEPYYGAAVARTPYEVAAGILTTGSTSLGGYEYSDAESEALIDVLNAYANQTGARITLTSDYEAGYATYANGADAFFTVASELVGDVCTITLTATNEATFYGYADEYYRVNNAHTAFESTYADAVVTVSPDGTTMTIVFTVAE